MATPAPDAVKRLVDHFGQDRKVFLSGDYKEEQLRAESLNDPCLTIRHSDLASTAPVGQRVIRTFYGPFFTTPGWDMDKTLDTIQNRNWGSVPLFSSGCLPSPITPVSPPRPFRIFFAVSFPVIQEVSWAAALGLTMGRDHVPY